MKMLQEKPVYQKNTGSLDHRAPGAEASEFTNDRCRYAIANPQFAKAHSHCERSEGMFDVNFF